MSYIVNNAEKFGITIIHMSKSSDGGSKGKDREKKYLQQSKDCIRIISDSNGNFFVENNIEWLAFKWLDAPSTLPAEFISKVTEATKPKELGNKYFSRYVMKKLFNIHSSLLASIFGGLGIKGELLQVALCRSQPPDRAMGGRILAALSFRQYLGGYEKGL